MWSSFTDHWNVLYLWPGTTLSHPKRWEQKGISQEITFSVFCTHFIAFARRFLGAFAKLRKETTSFVMSGCPSVSTEQPSSHWTDFHEIWYLNIFRKLSRKMQASLKSDKNNGRFAWWLLYSYLWPYLAELYSEWRLFQTEVVEEIKTHVVFWLTSFFLNHAVYEITWRNTVEMDRTQMTIWRMRIACCIPRLQTHTQHIS